MVGAKGFSLRRRLWCLQVLSFVLRTIVPWAMTLHRTYGMVRYLTVRAFSNCSTNRNLKSLGEMGRGGVIERMFIYWDFYGFLRKKSLKTLGESEKVIDFFREIVYTVCGVEYKPTKIHKMEQKVTA